MQNVSFFKTISSSLHPSHCHYYLFVLIFIINFNLEFGFWYAWWRKVMDGSFPLLARHFPSCRAEKAAETAEGERTPHLHLKWNSSHLINWNIKFALATPFRVCSETFQLIMLKVHNWWGERWMWRNVYNGEWDTQQNPINPKKLCWKMISIS